MELHTRLKQIEDLDAYLNEKNQLLLNAINTVGWTEETLHDEVVFHLLLFCFSGKTLLKELYPYKILILHL